VTFAEARAAYPVLARVAYLNAGSVGPLARAAFDAIVEGRRRDLAEGRSGRPYLDAMLAARDRVRAALGGEIGVPAVNVALTRSTSEGCLVVLAGLGLGPDDEIVTTDVEHFGLLGAVHASGAHVRVAAVRDRPAGEALEAILDEVARRTDRPFGVSFLMPFLEPPERVELAARRAGLVDFFYDDPDPDLVGLVHGQGALAAWQVGSAEEAKAAEAAGCDLVIAQGTEAGGHVRGRLPRARVLAEVLAAVEVPVLAAGAIATAADVAAALAVGADGVRVGTRLIATPEANAHPDYVSALIDASPEDTVLTEAFSVMWPDAPHRVLRSSVEAADAIEAEMVGEVELGGEKVPVPRFSVIAPGRRASGAIEAMALYAGEGVGAVREVRPAAEVIRELAAGAEDRR
jgi:NAD(P)H-dependent flavin oxidoreductase YrpB (nitropropane dioxygenase family)